MKKQKMFLPSVVACLILSACGGGGGGGSTSGGTTSALSASNASQASGVVIQAARLVSPAVTLGEIKSATGLSHNSLSGSPLLIALVNKTMSAAKTQTSKVERRIQGTLAPTSMACSNGGSIIVSATWTGPDNPSSTSQIVNLSGDISFNACTEGAQTYNGSIGLSVDGSLDTPTKIAISSSSLSYADMFAKDNLSMTNITMIFTGMQWNGDQLAGGAVTINGTITGMLDNAPANFASDNLTLSFNTITNAVTVSISGKVNASCLKDWVSITTNSPIVFPFTSGCPTAGEIVVTSSGDNVRLDIASSSSITVYFNNDLVQTYNSCYQIEGLCTS